MPHRARAASQSMPYGAGDKRKAPTTWKGKQRAFTVTGLQALRAPWARGSKSSDSQSATFGDCYPWVSKAGL